MASFLLLYCLNIIIFLRFARIWMDFFVELVTTPPVWWRRDPLPKTPLRKPPLHYTCPSVPKRRGIVVRSNCGQIFRLKFQDPSNPKKSQKIPLNNIDSFSTKSIKNIKNKIPANFPIYYLTNSHISKKNLPNWSKKNTFFFRGWGVFFSIGYLNPKNFRKIFLLRDFQPLSGHKKKKTGVYPSLL